MRITEAEKKRRQRDRAKRGGRVLQTVEIMDWDAWGEILREGGWLLGSVVNDRLVRDATRNFIWKLCKDHQKEKAERQLAEIQSPVTGLIEIERQGRIGRSGACSSQKTFSIPSKSIQTL